MGVKMTIEWDDKIKTGIPVIDEQHQDLLVMLNRLERLKCEKKSFLEAFFEIEDYAGTHFETEENVMIQTKYPEYKEHKSCHDEFKQELKIIKKKIDIAQDIHDIGTELYNFASGWIIKHYSDEDVKLVEFIKNS